MSEFGSLSTLLDELAPVVELEPPAWDDVLVRAAHLSSEPDKQPRRASSTRHRRRIAVLAVVAATAVVASALAAEGVNPLTALFNYWHSPANPGPLGGTYSTTLSGLTPARLNGRWTITFAQYPTANGYASGHYGNYVISQNGKVMEKGTFGAASGIANLTLTDTSGPAKCPDTRVGGAYQVTYDRSALKLQALFDRCPHRRIVLSTKLFTR